MKGIEAYKKELKLKEFYTDFWLDFGLVNSYYRSKSFLTTQRVFNDLEIKRFENKLMGVPKDQRQLLNIERRLQVNEKLYLFLLEKRAETIIAEIEKEEIWPDPVVTEVTALNNYHEAEAYHQDYFKNNPQNQYCSMVVAPKLAKFKKTFASRLRTE